MRAALPLSLSQPRSQTGPGLAVNLAAWVSCPPPFCACRSGLRAGRPARCSGNAGPLPPPPRPRPAANFSRQLLSHRGPGGFKRCQLRGPRPPRPTRPLSNLPKEMLGGALLPSSHRAPPACPRLSAAPALSPTPLLPRHSLPSLCLRRSDRCITSFCLGPERSKPLTPGAEAGVCSPRIFICL